VVIFGVALGFEAELAKVLDEEERMARSIFTITAPSDTARIDYQGHGEVVFTVTNAAGGAVRGRAKVILKEPKQTGWIKINGEVERDFVVNGTQQFTVSVDVPKDCKPGKYSFRFDVASVALPDEEYTQGPTISFSALPPPAQQKPSFPLWIIPVLAVLVLSVGGVVVWLLVRPTKPEAPAQATSTPNSEPSVSGMTSDDPAVKGEALTNADPLAAALRDTEPQGESRRGFYIGMATMDKHTLWGPGAQAIKDSLSPHGQLGFAAAAAYCLQRNNNADTASRGLAVVKADPSAETIRKQLPPGSWLGFDIGSGIFGNPAHGALGNTAMGPGSEKIRASLDTDGQRGFDAAVALYHPHR
jgi:hypothetical protein